MDHRITANISGVAPVVPQPIRTNADTESSTASNVGGPGSISGGFSMEEKQALELFEKTIRAIQGPEKSFEISIHKETHAIMVKVMDKSTGELIREIPKEKLLDVAANIMELNGLFFDEKA